MEIILIRHTTPKIDKGICYGQADIDVTSTFNEEVLAIKEQLPKNLNEFNVYSSPLLRCKKLAETLFSKITYDNRLKELDFGDWELKKWNDINQNELAIWMNNFVTQKTTNGESYIDLHTRTTNFINNIKSKNAPTILVTHAGVIRSIWAHATNTNLKNSFDLKLSYGAVIKITI